MKSFSPCLAALSAIFTLLISLSSISLSQASLTEPLINLGTLPPERADGPYQYWEKRNKYFLVVAVNETGLPDTQLSFTLVDAKEIADALTALGYQPLDPAHPILSGKQATRSSIIHTLTLSHPKKNKDHLLIYFIGHGIVEERSLATNLWTGRHRITSRRLAGRSVGS